MNKPSDQTIKDFLVDLIAERMKLPKTLVNTVVVEQFSGIAKAMTTETSVEMSGFGVFYFLPKKAEKALEGLKKIERGEAELPSYIKKSKEDLRKDLLQIENQLNKCRKLNK
jgi:nucleoid DNA-binding protein